MRITLYRFDQENQCVIESDALRIVDVADFFNKCAVRDGIKRCVANNGGPLAIEFKTIIFKTALRLAFIFDASEPGFRLRYFADVFAERIVDALKEKSQAMLAA